MTKLLPMMIPAALLAAACAQPEIQDTAPRTARSSSVGWGQGTMHIGGGVSFFNENNEVANTDVDTIAAQGEYGYLVTEQIEVLGQAGYSNRDFGAGLEATALSLMGGARYYVMTPTSAAPTAFYGEGRVGVVQYDAGNVDDSDLAFGAGGGFIWWPWGFDNNMAWDFSIDWLQSDVLEQVGFFVGMNFWW